METLRYDIVEQDGGWFLTDARGPLRVFVTLSEALSVAHSDARLRVEPTEIYLWRNGVPSQVYPRPGMLDS